MRASVLLLVALLCLSSTHVEAAANKCRDKKGSAKCLKKAKAKCTKAKWRKKKCCVTCKSYNAGTSSVLRGDGKIDCADLGGTLKWTQGANQIDAKVNGVCGKRQGDDLVVTKTNGGTVPCPSDQTLCYTDLTPLKCTPSWELDFKEKEGSNQKVIENSRGTVIFGTEKGFVYGVDSAAGALKFKYNYNGPGRSFTLFASVVGVVGGVVYGNLYETTQVVKCFSSKASYVTFAIDEDTGYELWAVQNETMSDKAGYTASGNTYWYYQGKLSALEAKTGAFKWMYQVGSASLVYPAPQLVGDDDFTYLVLNDVSGTATNLAVVKLWPNGTAHWSQSFKQSKLDSSNKFYTMYPPVPQYAEPILDSGNGGQLIVTAGTRTAQALPNRTNPEVQACVFSMSTLHGTVNWRYELPTPTTPYSTGHSWMIGNALVYNNIVYFRTGTLLAEDAIQKSLYAVHKEGGHLIWFADISNATQTFELAAANGEIIVADAIDMKTASASIVRQKGKLYWFDAYTGALKKSDQVDGEITAGPATGAVSKQIYVSHSFKNVYDPKYMEEVRDKADGCTTGQPLDQPYVDRTPREAKVLAYSSDSAQSGCGA
jgi:outer membrane protein assembly factor BamB